VTPLRDIYNTKIMKAGGRMNSNTKLLAAISAILSGAGNGFAYAEVADGTAVGSDAIQEIVVTAQRRSENMQDVPIQIQVLTAETLTQLNVSTFDDFVKYLPNVTAAMNGPGQGDIYMRGLSVGAGLTQDAGGNGTFPNVAIYLDDQSGQIPGRNLDVYAADLERIEVLEGPQGTLFGAGAQAGVLRYITNKPVLNATEGNLSAGYAVTAHGDPSANATGVLNVPLIPDTLAVRAVIYSDSRGGYIDNVPGTFTREASDLGIHYANYATKCAIGTPTGGGICAGAGNMATAFGVPPGSPVANNSSLVQNAFNPVTYQGIRASTLYKINDDWNVLLVQSYQDMNAQGVFYETPVSSGSAAQALPDLSVQLYNPSYDKDRFENTALTVNGHLGALKLVYSGSYLVRNVDQQQDYTNYARGVYTDYYQCTSPAQTGKPGQCYSPSSTWQDKQKDTHDSQEIRVSTPDEWRLRGIAGAFWEDYVIQETTDWLYKTAPGFAPVVPPQSATSNNPNVRGENVAFFDDVTRGYRQAAAFGSTDFDIIPKTLTATVGTRYYKFINSELGSSVSSFGCYVGATTTTPCNNYGASTNLNAQNLHNTSSGFKSRANLSWHITSDALLYYTWSQGFRPGGFNRSSTLHLDGTFETPLTYAPDTLVNNELGWKTVWFGHRLEVNGAVYQEDWKNVQVSFYDAQAGLGNLTFTTNGPNYRVRGLETQFVARVTHGLTLTGAASWNSSNQTNSPYLIGVHGQPITSIPNPYGPLNSSLAMSPPFQANLRVRYELAFGEYTAFWQVGGVHQAHSYSATGNVEAYNQPGFTTYDASLGVAKDAWSVSLYGQNVTDTRAITYINDYQFVVADAIERPRTMGLRFGYKF
jgi:iron complex outermembrane recepter protein